MPGENGNLGRPNEINMRRIAIPGRNHVRIQWPLVLLLLAAILGAGSVNGAVSSTEYCDRGNRFEGTRTLPVTGESLELVSVQVCRPDAPARPGDPMHVTFYLPDTSVVSIVVREVELSYNYWMDRVRPSASGWVPGKVNDFSWPASDVLQKLDALSPSNLGVLVTVGPANGRDGTRRICPAAMFSGRTPKAVSAISFICRPTADANVTPRIDGPLDYSATFDPMRIRDQEPAALDWPCADRVPGWYVLTLRGYFLNDEVPIQMKFEFYNPGSQVWANAGE
jgi:hypothetical protein